MKIVVTLNSFKNHTDMFDEFKEDVIFRFDDSITIDDIKDADIIIGKFDLKLVDKAEKLKYIHWGMAGSDTINDAIKNKNIILTNSTGCFSESIAEHIVGMILYFYKNFDKYTKNQPKHLYIKQGETKSIIGSNILIVGCGSIGNTFGLKAKMLGANVTGLKRTKKEKPDYLDHLYTMEKLDECLKEADVVVMCLPQTKETYHLMNEEKLGLLKQDALLINVGRGSAIDTTSLIKVLKEKRIKAALDVYEKEPLEADSELWDLDNCLLLPHVTGNDTLPLTRKLLRELAINNLKQYLNGEKLENLVDSQTGYKISDS